jgi:hypothetical protein
MGRGSPDQGVHPLRLHIVFISPLQGPLPYLPGPVPEEGVTEDPAAPSLINSTMCTGFFVSFWKYPKLGGILKNSPIAPQDNVRVLKFVLFLCCFLTWL